MPTTEKGTQTGSEDVSGSDTECEGDVSGSETECEGDVSGSETECEGDSADPESEGEWYYDYDMDPNYHGSPYHSQPMHCLRGNSYTPPGWMRVYKKRKPAKHQDTTPQAAKKLKFD